MLKSHKIVRKIAPVVLASLIVLGGISYGHGRASETENLRTTQSQSTQLVSEFGCESMAKLYGVDDLLFKNEDGRIVRFDMQGASQIDVIVDEESFNIMTEENIQAINIAINNYNELFQQINPEYSFRYIPKEVYDKSPTTNPCIFITTQLRINSPNGIPHASTMPPQALEKESDFGLRTNNSFMYLSTTSLVNLTVSEQAAIIQHEIAHALGVGGHELEDNNSIMSAYGVDESIASTKFSSDVLYALTAMYYNPKTNSKSMKDIEKYIKAQEDMRNNEIEMKFPRKPTQQEQDKINSSTFSQHVSSTIDVENILNANGLIGKEFASTNSYGVATTIHLTENNVYYFSSTYNGRSIRTTGSYRFDNNQCILEGKIVLFDEATHSLSISNIDEIRIQYLSDNSIVWGAKSSGFELNTNYNIIDNSMEMDLN